METLVAVTAGSGSAGRIPGDRQAAVREVWILVGYPDDSAREGLNSRTNAGRIEPALWLEITRKCEKGGVDALSRLDTIDAL